MALYERDYILRIIKQLVEAIARALGLAKEGKHHEAQQLLEESCVHLLGMEYHALAVVDAATAAQLLNEPARVFAFARLVAALGDVAHAAGDRTLEQSHCVHATQLLQEVLARKPRHGEAAELLASLRTRLEGLAG